MSAMPRILLCLIALLFLLGATSRVNSILDIPDGTTNDFEPESCDFIPSVLYDCFTPFDMAASPPGFTFFSSPFPQQGTVDAPFDGVYMVGNNAPILIETLGRPWKAFGISALAAFSNPGIPYTRTRLRALDEDGEELGRVGLALFGSEVRFLGIESDLPIHAVEISGGAGPLAWDTIRFSNAAEAIDVDIRPGSLQNVINPGSKGVIPAAILGSADLDVLDIALESVTLAGAAATRQGGGEPSCHVRPVNHDAWPDLVCLFETDRMSMPDAALYANLIASTLDGRQLEGRDVVRIVPVPPEGSPEPPVDVPGETPLIESVTFAAQPIIASCDFTYPFLAWHSLCGAGPILFGPVVVESQYTEIQIDAKVSDPQTTPDANDIKVVAASFPRQPNRDDFIILQDDGSTDSIIFPQRDFVPQNCQLLPGQQVCTCFEDVYQTSSHDLFAQDEVFTAVEPMVDGQFLPRHRDGLMLDCIARARELGGIIRNSIVNTQVDFRIEAVDQSGNLTEWSQSPSAFIAPSQLSCSGDPCACCLFLNFENPGDPIADGGCFGLPGLMFDPGFYCRQVSAPPGVPPHLLGLPCFADSDCGGAFRSCRQSPQGRDCPQGYCMSRFCLLP